MTYPPQQPGPYGQQPGSYGQPGGGYPDANQQYGQGQYDQYGQQGGYGGGPGGTQQFPQADAYGQQHDAYGQQQGAYAPYEQQRPFPGGEPPQKKKTGLIVAIAIAGIVVIGGVVTLVLVNSDKTDQALTPASASSETQAPGVPQATTSKSKSPSSSSKAPTSSSSPSSGAGSGPAPGGRDNPQDLANDVLAALNSGNSKAFLNTICRSTYPKGDLKVPTGFHVEPTGPLQQTGETAKIQVTGTQNGKTEPGVLNVKKESGVWCLSGVAGQNPG
jgi:hypothetical protein